MPWFVVMTLILFGPVAFVSLYVGRKIFISFVSEFHWDRRKVKLTVVIAYVYLNLLPLLYAVLFFVVGRRATIAFTGDYPVVDLFIVYPFWFTLIVTFQLFILFLLVDLGNLLGGRVFKLQMSWWRNRESRIVLLVALFMILYSGITVAMDTWTVRLSQKQIQLPAEFRTFDGFRIAQVSDVQGDGRVTPRRLMDFVEKVNSLNPDITFFAGDLVSSGEDYIESTANILGKLRAKYGVLAAVGDHDIFSNRVKVVTALRANSINVIEDSSIVVKTDQGNLEISGITYTYRQKPNETVLANATNSGEGCYRVLLSHQPAMRLVDYARQRGYHLFIAGHTHGGGIAFGIPGLYVVAPASFETRYLSGLYRVGEMFVSVTNGLGSTLAPVRFHAPAEYTLLTLVK